jgi:iron(III) transport system ATP-binding protein
MLELRQLSIQYPNAPSFVVSDIDITLKRGEIACLLGPSGCGKTSVLRAIAGFIAPSSGEIWLNGKLVSDKRTHLAPEKRGVGVVFQDYALFPHLTVAQNTAFGLRKLASQEKAARVKELIAMVGLDAFAHRYPHELSGGQQQRVALARALAPEPALLLLDEPFSNLDVELREKLSHEVREILKASNTTAILVTHDQNEAFAMADHIGVLQNGKLAQWNTPYHLYHEPATREVADFIGQGVFLPGTIRAGAIQIELGELTANTQATPNPFDVLIRPDDIIHDDNSPLQAKVLRRSFRGSDFLYTLELESGHTVLAMVPSHHNHAIGEKIGIKLAIDHVITFARNGRDTTNL